uniref:Uncharacterized protein n=1 Tax=Macaca fascicularis TaxID=9541 RepID=A0A7N9CXL4_MACFA
MRTLAILAAILLVALQAQAESLQERADEAATQEQPGEDDQDLAVSFEENGLSTLRASGVFGDIRNPVTCVRSGAICLPGFCPRRYKHIGVCGVSAIKCCKKP